MRMTRTLSILKRYLPTSRSNRNNLFHKGESIDPLKTRALSEHLLLKASRDTIPNKWVWIPNERR